MTPQKRVLGRRWERTIRRREARVHADGHGCSLLADSGRGVSANRISLGGMSRKDRKKL